MTTTQSFYRAHQGFIDRMGGKAIMSQSADIVGASTTAKATDIVIPGGAEITRLYVDFGNAPSATTTMDVGISTDTDSIINGDSLTTTDLRRTDLEPVIVSGLVMGDDDETIWVDFSRTDAAMRAKLTIEYKLKDRPQDADLPFEF